MSGQRPPSRPNARTGPAAAAGALFVLALEVVRRSPREMSLTSLSTLSTLERTGPRRLTDLAAVEGVTQPSMSALVAALERTGLVERLPHPTDRRVALVASTAEGSRYIRARRAEGAASFARLIEELPADEGTALSAAIPALEHLRRLGETAIAPEASRGRALPANGPANAAPAGASVAP